MKITFLFSLLLFFHFGQVDAQKFNTEITPEGKSPRLLGKINKEALSDSTYAWFTENHKAYEPKQAIVDQFKTTLQDYTITAFMGTWCGDSKREVPKFYKTLEAAEFPLERLTMVGVDSKREAYKQSPGGEEEGLMIHRVPTFIFYKDGKEVNRIVESPLTSMEEDIHQLLTGDYHHNYQGVPLVDALLSETEVRKFNKKQKKLLPKLKKVVKNRYELNTYSNVLFFDGKREEGILVARLNTLLFPKETGTHGSLANKLKQVGKTEEAVTYYQKALSLDPENKTYQTALADIDKNEARE